MGWPKGKPRKPRPLAVSLDEGNVSDAEHVPARYDPDAVAPRGEPTAVAGADPEYEREIVAHAERRSRAKRRPRRLKTGVKIGKTWYSCVAARWERDGAALVLILPDPRNTGVVHHLWIPIDWSKPIEARGIILPTLVSPTAGGTAETPGVPRKPRLVNVEDHVNVDPDRDQMLREHRRRTNAELEDLVIP